MAGSFTWIGGTIGAWTDAAAWTPSGGPPGAGDTAYFPSGQGAFAVAGGAIGDAPAGDPAVSVVVGEDGTLDGSFAFGSLTVADGFDQVTLTGGTDTIGTLQTLGTLVITQAVVTAGSVVVGAPPAGGPGTMQHGRDGWLTLQDHGTLLAAAVSVNVGLSDQTVLRLDATSQAEIGSAGTGAAGTLTVDADGSILGGVGTIVAPVLLNRGTVAVGVIQGTVLNEGTLSGIVTGGTNDGVMSGTIHDVVNNGTIVGGLIGNVTGPGTILVGNFLGLERGNSGTIVFDQPAGRLIAYGASALDGLVLTGFDSAAAIELVGVTATEAAWAPIGGGLGTIALSQAGSIVATVTVAGTQSDATFVALPDLQLGSGTALYLADGPFGAGTVPPSPGVATTDPLLWVGGGGNWGDVTHWRLGTATPVTAAPGSGNDAVIRLGARAEVLSGQGDAASLTLFGQMILSGIVTAGTLWVGSGENGWGAAYVWQGATVTAGLTHLDDGQLWAHGGRVALDGTVTVGAFGTDPRIDLPHRGTLAAIEGGSVQAAGPVSIRFGLVTLDATSTLEIGSGHTAGAGTITVDADGWIGQERYGSGTLASAAILNAGTIAGLTLAGLVANQGLLQGVTAQAVQNDGTVIDGVIRYLTGTGAVEVSELLSVATADVARIAFLDDTATLGLTIGTGAAPLIAGFVQGDMISAIGVTATGVAYAATGDDVGTLSFLDGTSTVASLTLSGDYTGHTFYYRAAGSVVTLDAPAPPPCFVTGTLIRTRRGEVPVEELRLGDEVATRLPLGFRPIRWIGHRTLRPAAHPDPSSARPIRVRAGAFGRALPRRDLLLSPDHALYLEGVLIPVKLLVDGDAIAPLDLPQVTYWHVELDRHDVLLAEGLPAESYLDAGDRQAFDDGRVVALHPRFGWLAHEADGCAPLVVTGRVVERLRADLGRRAARQRTRVHR